MNKITPRRIAIFSSEMMMKKEFIAVANSTAEGLLLVQCSTRRDEGAPDATVVEPCGVLPGSQPLAGLLLRRRDASAAVLPYAECAHRDRRFCLGSTRRIWGLLR